MRSKFIIAVLLFSAYSGFGQTKTEGVQGVNVKTTKAILLGQTKPIKDLVAVPSTNRAKKAEYKKRNTAAPENFMGRGTSKVTRQELEHQGPDPLRQTSISKGRVAAPTLISDINIDGLASTFGSPNDPTGDVGNDYYVQAINATTVAVYNKSDGSLVQDFAANALWTSIGESSAGDPIILFDHENDRWIITEFTSPGGSASMLFAISLTSDPLGSYYVYLFTPPSFPDYPKWAIWKDTYMVTTNEFGPGALHQYFFDKQALLAGESEVDMQRVEITGNNGTEAGFYVSTPVSWIGDVPPVDSNPIAVKINDSSWGEVAEDVIEVFTFEVDFEGTTTVEKTSIVTTPFDAFPCDNTTNDDFSCFSQGGSSQGIDGIPEVVMNLPHYRNFETHESIVLSFITDVTDGENLSGIRWMELRRTDGGWELYQEGTFAPDDGLHRFMPSISMDKDGNIGLAYNFTSSSDFVGIKSTGRFAEDELGMMTLSEFDVVDGTGSVGGDRFGDYAQMAIDPVDKRTFWYTSEYAATGGSKTRIFAFQIEKNSSDLAIASIDDPSSSVNLSADETVSVTVKNRGELSASNFDLILKLDDVVVDTYTHMESLAADESLEHDFSTTVDLSEFGDYAVSVEVALAGDEVDGNNEKTVEVINFAENDASVSLEGATSVCGDNVLLDVEIKNEGGTLLETVDIEVYLNAVLVETINWTGELETGESETEEVLVADLISGDNDVSVSISNPNEVVDQVLEDNEALFNVNFDNTLDQIKLVINTDQYPEETTWEILDSEGEVVESGGPYPSLVEVTITELLCVDPDACYEFVINDLYEDGICCEFGDGSYSISDSNDNLIFESDGQFGEFENTPFCIGAECNLIATTDVINASNEDLGVISIDASGSYGYEYSIDGGSTFQESPIFDELESGSYNVYVGGQDGNCSFEEIVVVGFDCSLSISTSQETTANGIGSIEIVADGGDTYEYSIDGGSTFQTSSTFLNVPSGTYDIEVVSNNGECTVTETFNLDFVLGTSEEQSITVAPNPTQGVFTISVPEHNYIKGFLEVKVLDLNGRVIQNHRFSKYDNSFQGTISLYAYPNGIYFLKLVNAETDRLVKIIKQ